MLRFLPGPTVGTRRNLQQRRSHAGALCVCSCCGLWHATEPSVLTAWRSRPAGVLTTALDAVLPWTCVWPPPSQRQLAEMLHRRHSIVN